MIMETEKSSSGWATLDRVQTFSFTLLLPIGAYISNAYDCMYKFACNM